MVKKISHLIERLLHPEHIAVLILRRIKFFLVCVLFFVSLGIFKYWYEEVSTPRNVYQINFSTHAVGKDILKETLYSPDFLSSVATSLNLSNKTDMVSALQSGLHLPSKLEEEKIPGFTVRFLEKNSEISGPTFLNAIGARLEQGAKNHIKNKEAAQFPIEVPLTQNTSMVSLRDIFSDIIKMESFTECIDEVNSSTLRFEFDDSIPIDELDSSSPPTLKILSSSEDEELGEKGAEQFIYCYNQLPLEDINSLFSSIMFFGPLSPKFKIPYFNESRRIFRALLRNEDILELQKISNLPADYLLNTAVNFYLRPGKDKNEMWLLVGIKSISIASNRKIATFLQKILFDSPNQIQVGEVGVFNEKPTLIRVPKDNFNSAAVRKVKISVKEPAKFIKKAPPKYQLFATTLLFGFIGVFVAVGWLIVSEKDYRQK